MSTSVRDEGKTKVILETVRPSEVFVKSKPDLTAGDGKKHDIIDGKDILANETTCNVFSLLESCGIPVAFLCKVDERTFLAHSCKMYKLEVVLRRESHGSYLKRN